MQNGCETTNKANKEGYRLIGKNRHGRQMVPLCRRQQKCIYPLIVKALGSCTATLLCGFDAKRW